MKNYPIITKKILTKLFTPKASSHKRDNGRLLIIAGSNRYYGALVYTIKTASRLVDLIYLISDKNNQKLIAQLKLKTAEFMPTPTFPYRGDEPDFDCILIGPGLGISVRTRKLVEKTLKTGIKAVLDADALNVMDERLKRRLNDKHILTPHRGEFKRLFKLKPSTENVKKMMQKYGCTIVLKGPVDYVASPQTGLRQNKTGNAGLTKGGTGDALAGLMAALYCKNKAHIAAAAGVYINGVAGDDLYKKVGTFYDAEDLTEQLPKTLQRLTTNN